MFDSVERRIFESYMKDSEIDPEDFMKALQKDYEDKASLDIMAGQTMVEKGKI